MKFSDDRISSIAHLIQKALIKGRMVVSSKDDLVLREVKRGLIDFFKAEDLADEFARQKVASLKRGVQEGSREWEILYRKYFEEELQKRGH